MASSETPLVGLCLCNVSYLYHLLIQSSERAENLTPMIFIKKYPMANIVLAKLLN